MCQNIKKYKIKDNHKKISLKMFRRAVEILYFLKLEILHFSTELMMK